MITVALTGSNRNISATNMVSPPGHFPLFNLARARTVIDHVQAGREGRIILKMNSLIDSKLISALYTASQAGVKIDLIIRGICSLKPQVPGFSENIHVISIIGRFLEHDRIFYFDNCDNPRVYIGSADWRPRNLDRRVEAVVPIKEPENTQYLKHLLTIFLEDHRQGWELQPEGNYSQRIPSKKRNEQGSHEQLMDNHQLHHFG